MTRIAEAFRQADLDPSDDLVGGLKKIVNIEQCREVLLSILYPHTKALSLTNEQLISLVRRLKEQRLELDRTHDRKLLHLQRQLDSLQSSSASLLKTAKEDDCTINSLKSQTKSLEASNASLLAKLEDLNHQNEDLVLQQERLDQENSKVIREKDEQISSLSLQLEGLTQSQNTCLTQNHELTGENNQLKEQLSLTENHKFIIFGHLKRCLTTIVALQNDLKSQNRASLELQKQIEHLEKRSTEINQKSESEVVALRNQLASLINDMNTEKGTFEKCRIEMEDKYKCLELELDAARGYITKLEEDSIGRKQELEAAYQYLARARKVICSSSSQNYNILLKNQSLRQNIHELVTSLKGKDESLLSLKRDIDKMTRENDSLSNRLEKTEHELVTMRGDNGHLSKQLDQCKVQLQRARTTLTSLAGLQAKLAEMARKSSENETVQRSKVYALSKDLQSAKAFKGNATVHLRKSCDRINLLNNRLQAMHAELGTRQKMLDASIHRYNYLLSMNVSMRTCLKEIKDSTIQWIQISKSQKKEIIDLKGSMERQNLKLSTFIEKHQSSMGHLRLLSQDYCTMKEQRNLAMSMLYRAVTRSSMSTASQLLNEIKNRYANIWRENNTLKCNLQKCLGRLAEVESNFECLFVKHKLETATTAKRCSDDAKAFGHFLQRVRTASELHDKKIESFERMKSSISQLQMYVVHFIRENGYLKAILSKYKSSMMSLSKELNSQEAKWQNRLHKDCQDQEILVGKAKAMLTRAQEFQEYSFEYFSHTLKKELSELDGQKNQQLDYLRQENRKIAEKLVNALMSLKRLHQSSMALTQRQYNMNIGLQQELNEAHLQTITLRDFSQHRLAELKLQLSNLEASQNKQNAAKNHILSYTAQGIKNTERLRNILILYNDRLQLLGDLLNGRNRENAVLKQDLLTSRCRSTEPYIEELERRLTLMQGQLTESNEQNLRMMELLQIKLSQDVRGRVTKHQAEREVLLLRETTSIK